MTQLTAREVADAWVAAGGPKSRATEWTAIAMGESAFRTDAISSAGALGLWQIMPFNWSSHGVPQSRWQDPVANATVAVRMSGGGTNCAAWDSCYADIERSGRLSYLPWPQVGSADYNNLAVVSAEIGTDKLGGAVPPPGTWEINQLAGAAADMQRLADKLFPALDRRAIGQRMRINRLYTPGWRP